MNDCMSQGVDVEPKILQTLLSLLTNFPAVRGRLLQTCVLQFHFRAVPFSSTLSLWVMNVAARIQDVRRVVHGGAVAAATGC